MVPMSFENNVMLPMTKKDDDQHQIMMILPTKKKRNKELNSFV